MHVLIKRVDAAIEPEEVVELRHEVASDGPAEGVRMRRRRKFALEAAGRLLRLRAVVGLPSAVGIFHGDLRRISSRGHCGWIGAQEQRVRYGRSWGAGGGIAVKCGGKELLRSKRCEYVSKSRAFQNAQAGLAVGRGHDMSVL